MLLIADLHIDSYAGVLFLKRAIFFDLAVEGQRYADFISTRTQRGWQRVHHVNQRASALQRRSLRADHENSHSTFDVGCFAFDVFFIPSPSQIFAFYPLQRLFRRLQRSF